MKLTGNTIFITGGGSGIGRGLAEALHGRGNKVIIAGRRRGHLDEVIAANPGMAAIELDITDPASIDRVAAQLIADYPELNALINNAGIMLLDQVGGRIDDALMVSTITTNLMGPIRMTSALIDHLKTQNDAVVAYTSSVLAFVPLAAAAVYSSTKAALHSYILSQRLMLRDTKVRVLEIAPPWVRTDLINSREAELAMPLDAFIAETIAVLGTDADEVLVEGARPLRANPGPGEQAVVHSFNAQMTEALSGSTSDVA
ncbi:SDR family oxidoreductase [Paraburkholderia kirstenboschensis]|uniref:SDR family NAD(P)-dependent oxidoreductase n=1 Tax=Paraburkholderia kirstenboschensis TaxID=1245436 RepID=A0ABZ0EAH5_9BURK|nr:SDR family NAD(P)-dependent oxidoreductase [Paraburkholderia kirstenboschensis]WOD13505.1 SDR family NAD(P)-dependent oxidoreductase [Paraburkholderia kirstenboschensis]